GTKTRLAVFSSDGDFKQPLIQAIFQSGKYATLESLVQEFLAQHSYSIERASFGVAGPVIEGSATITNLPWRLDEQHIAATLHIPSVCLLNDLSAMATAIPFLDEKDIYTLNEGEPVQHGTLALIAAGTGLGEAFLMWNGLRYQPYPSEGGHADFAPRDEQQINILRYLHTHLEHVSYEQVCSGRGLPNVYDALKHTEPSLEEPAWLAQQLRDAEDKTPIISNAALDQKNPCELCVATMTTFASILGAEVGNLALKLLSTGGVYIGGGIPPRILSFLQTERFMQAFCQKGRLSPLLAAMPIHVILNSNVGLIGAARHAFSLA
ncbi:MAG TPA: glucokinase, partial [Ktedonobacter sp.]|nr:glucokinase [Ktedonobacter sp.]